MHTGYQGFQRKEVYYLNEYFYTFIHALWSMYKLLTFKNFAIFRFHIVIIIFCIIMKKIVAVSFDVGINNRHQLSTLSCQIINHFCGLREFNRIPREIPGKWREYIFTIIFHMNQKSLSQDITSCINFKNLEQILINKNTFIWIVFLHSNRKHIYIYNYKHCYIIHFRCGETEAHLTTSCLTYTSYCLYVQYPATLHH